MVWKDSLWVDDDVMTFTRFLDRYLPSFWSRDPREAVRALMWTDYKRRPRDVIFANFICLRCGLCCSNHDGARITAGLEEKLMADGKRDLLKQVIIKKGLSEPVGDTRVTRRGSCTLCRKSRGKPYYYCRVHEYKDFLPACRGHLCSKSLPVAHLRHGDVEELISMIGLDEYYSLIERDWGEEFDWSRSMVKTHPQRPETRADAD
jgi:hypothetical protein